MYVKSQPNPKTDLKVVQEEVGGEVHWLGGAGRTTNATDEEVAGTVARPAPVLAIPA
jgi:hypothetical protein